MQDEIPVKDGLDALELTEDLEWDGTTFPKGGFVVFSVDGNACNPPIYLARDQFLNLLTKEPQNGDQEAHPKESQGDPPTR